MNIRETQRPIRQILISILGLILLAPAVLAQEVTNRACKAWDDGYSAVFQSAFWGVLILTPLLSLASGLLGRRLWFFTKPGLRVLIVSFLIFLAASIAIAAGPWLFGLGNLWFYGVQPDYFSCANKQFGATGLLGGLVGRDIPAINQWPTMIMLFAVASFAGGLIAWIVNQTANRSSVQK